MPAYLQTFLPACEIKISHMREQISPYQGYHECLQNKSFIQNTNISNISEKYYALKYCV